MRLGLSLVCGGLGGLGLLSACQRGTDEARDDTAAIAECATLRVTECPDPPISYGDVAPIFQRKCTLCHDGAPGGPWPLTTYDDAADWQDTIRADVLDCSMPPLDSGVALDDEERFAISSWVRCGSPR